MAYISLIYAVYLLFFSRGFFTARRGHRRFTRIAAQIYNARIDRMHRAPYTRLVAALEAKKLLPAVLAIAVINFGMVVVQFLLGLVLLAPFLAGLNGQATGHLLSWGDRRTIFPHGFLQVLLQFAAFSAAAGAGMLIGVRWLYHGLPFGAALAFSPRGTAAALAAAVLLLCAAALVEAAGPICWGVQGVPSLGAIRQKAYLKLQDREESPPPPSRR